jgi:hypothetical protein
VESRFGERSRRAIRSGWNVERRFRSLCALTAVAPPRFSGGRSASGGVRSRGRATRGNPTPQRHFVVVWSTVDSGPASDAVPTDRKLVVRGERRQMRRGAQDLLW